MQAIIGSAPRAPLDLRRPRAQPHLIEPAAPRSSGQLASCSRARIIALASPYSTSNGNLGVLSPGVEVSGDNSWALQRVGPESFQNREPYADPATIVPSVVLLVLMLGFTFQRIFGLDRIVAQAIVKWKEEREEKKRREIMDARQQLLETWTDESSGDGPEGTGKGGSGTKGL